MSTFRLNMPYTDSFERMEQKAIEDNLEGICYDVVETEYTHNLSQQELAEKKTELSEVTIKLKKIDSQKKEITDKFKAELLEPKREQNRLLEIIEHKSERLFGKLYMVDDQEEGMMYFFNTSGICVDARPLYSTEKQIKLKVENQ